MSKWDHYTAFEHAMNCVKLLSKSRDQMSFSNYIVTGNDDYLDETKIDNEVTNMMRVFFHHSVEAIREAQKIRNFIMESDDFKQDFVTKQKTEIFEFLEEKCREEKYWTTLHPAVFHGLKKKLRPSTPTIHSSEGDDNAEKRS